MASHSPRGPRLDVPAASRRTLRSTFNPETFGNVSERIARFIAYMTVFIIFWLCFNIWAPESMRPDTYPFIFLTLLLSLQASYAAPLILLAQNRQADRDRVQNQYDRDRTERIMAETEYLSREIADLRIGIGEVATRDFVRGELGDMLEDLQQRIDALRASLGTE